MLCPHDPNWFEEFAAIRSVFSEDLGHLILDILHVGSTSVPDLLAKPTLDIDIVIADYSSFDDLIAGLSRLGYAHRGDQGIFQREVFKPRDSVAPNLPRVGGWMHHHLYVCPVSGSELKRHIQFRDALRASSGLRREYEAIKMNISSRSGADRKIYARIKEIECKGFFERVLRQAD